MIEFIQNVSYISDTSNLGGRNADVMRKDKPEPTSLRNRTCAVASDLKCSKPMHAQHVHKYMHVKISNQRRHSLGWYSAAMPLVGC